MARALRHPTDTWIFTIHASRAACTLTTLTARCLKNAKLVTTINSNILHEPTYICPKYGLALVRQMGQNSVLGSLKVVAILVMAALALTLSLAAFVPAQQSFAANGKAAKAQTWRGQIANVQLDSGGEPDWIQSGTWPIKKRRQPRRRAVLT